MNAIFRTSDPPRIARRGRFAQLRRALLRLRVGRALARVRAELGNLPISVLKDIGIAPDDDRATHAALRAILRNLHAAHRPRPVSIQVGRLRWSF